EGRMVNIHPSLLPNYPRLDTHRRALEAGDAETGCTVHLVTNDLDGGPVLGQARVPVLPGDDEASLTARVLAEEHKLYPAALSRLVRGKI
ncbi:MAG TPA: formyltransferase family protein, partial [Caulobacteraceae bacterium]|nr:formyltransferase family protein [Caulobacteraceae bacterium]